MKKQKIIAFITTAFPFLLSPKYPLIGVFIGGLSLILFHNLNLFLSILFLSLIGNYLFVYNFSLFNKAYNYQTEPIFQPSIKVKTLCYLGDIIYFILFALSAFFVYSLYLKTGFSLFTGSLIIYLLLLPVFNLWYQWFIRR